MGKLTKFFSDRPGFLIAPPERFPWGGADSRHADVLWYSLFVAEEGGIQVYGFRSTGKELWNLSEALKALGPDDDALLIAIWKSDYTPQNLILIDIATAKQRLQKP